MCHRMRWFWGIQRDRFESSLVRRDGTKKVAWLIRRHPDTQRTVISAPRRPPTPLDTYASNGETDESPPRATRPFPHSPSAAPLQFELLPPRLAQVVSAATRTVLEFPCRPTEDRLSAELWPVSRRSLL